MPLMAQQQLSIIEKAHKTTFKIEQSGVVTGDSSCSATAIGPHALLTDSHCEQPSDTLYVLDHFPTKKAVAQSDEGAPDSKWQIKSYYGDGPGNTTKATIVKIIRDGGDHSIYLVSGITFDSYSNIELDHTFTMGENVFMIGNPKSLTDIYRQGYYAGLYDGFVTKYLVFDMLVDHGDSGASVFDKKTGNIVTTISGKDDEGKVLELSYKFTFTKEQINAAVNFDPKKVISLIVQ